ncbi:hypothetical protein ACIQF5_21755 [Streptomyces goshikiensis]|uniref:hypothetical protein n=1 Tax=Streptomyces goshikiensis TaxID=1942 RepID=UPI00380619DB
MSDASNVTIVEIPTTTAPTPQTITPGCRVRLVSITPVCLVNLTGTTQATTSRSKTRLDVLLDESSTEARRRDHRVDSTNKVSRPAPDEQRTLLRDIPTGCMLLADNDS